jgi:hypothetical protein
MSDIQKELLEMSGITAKKSEDRQAFLERLVDAVQKVADKDEAKWDELSTEAQNWMNAATEETKAKEAITDYDEDEDEEPAPKKKKKKAAAAEEDEEETTEEGDEEEEEKGDEEDEEEEKPVSTKAKKKAPAKKAAAEKKAAPDKKPAKKAADEKPAKKAAADKPRASVTPKDTGMKVRIKKLLIKKPAMSVEDLMAKLEAGPGGAPSKYTVAGIRADFRHSLHVLKGEGLLEIEI